MLLAIRREESRSTECKSVDGMSSMSGFGNLEVGLALRLRLRGVPGVAGAERSQWQLHGELG